MDVVPDGRAAEVYVKVGVTAADGHEAVLLDFGILHRQQIVCGVFMRRLHIRRPHGVHPIQLNQR